MAERLALARASAPVWMDPGAAGEIVRSSFFGARGPSASAALTAGLGLVSAASSAVAAMGALSAGSVMAGVGDVRAVSAASVLTFATAGAVAGVGVRVCLAAGLPTSGLGAGQVALAGVAVQGIPADIAALARNAIGGTAALDVAAAISAIVALGKPLPTSQVVPGVFIAAAPVRGAWPGAIATGVWPVPQMLIGAWGSDTLPGAHGVIQETEGTLP